MHEGNFKPDSQVPNQETKMEEAIKKVEQYKNVIMDMVDNPAKYEERARTGIMVSDIMDHFTDNQFTKEELKAYLDELVEHDIITSLFVDPTDQEPTYRNPQISYPHVLESL